MADWSRLLSDQLFNDTVETLASPTTIAKMQVEHIRAALDTATVFSTPAAAEGDGQPRFRRCPCGQKEAEARHRMECLHAQSCVASQRAVAVQAS